MASSEASKEVVAGRKACLGVMVVVVLLQLVAIAYLMLGFSAAPAGDDYVMEAALRLVISAAILYRFWLGDRFARYLVLLFLVAIPVAVTAMTIALGSGGLREQAEIAGYYMTTAGCGLYLLLSSNVRAFFDRHGRPGRIPS